MGRLSEREVEQSYGGANNVVIRHKRLSVTRVYKIGETVLTAAFFATNHRDNKLLFAHDYSVSGHSIDAS